MWLIITMCCVVSRPLPPPKRYKEDHSHHQYHLHYLQYHSLPRVAPPPPYHRPPPLDKVTGQDQDPLKMVSKTSLETKT